MATWYTNIVLTIIAILLGAAIAKLYFPSAQQIGPQIALPTRGEVLAAAKLTNPSERQARIAELRARSPVVWINGGNIDVSGSNVTVDGEVSIAQ